MHQLRKLEYFINCICDATIDIVALEKHCAYLLSLLVHDPPLVYYADSQDSDLLYLSFSVNSGQRWLFWLLLL